MRRQMVCCLVFVAVFVVVATNFGLGALHALRAEENLAVNETVTAKIRAFDEEFFKGFDVYSAGTQENPTALLFDRKDTYALGSQLWGRPLKTEQVIYAIQRLDDQYVNRQYNIPYQPRALSIVNVKGEVLGYVYTGLTYVQMYRQKDGQVFVYFPVADQFGGDRGGGDGVEGAMN
jgi:hypothetical protein